MKLHAFIYIILLILSGGCRSNRELNRSVEKESQTARYDTSTKLEHSGIEVQKQESSISLQNEVRNIRTVFYRDDGSISHIQEEQRTTGSVKLDDGSGRSSSFSMKEENDSTSTSENEKEKDIEREKKITDSRPVQGSEWIFVALGICLAIFIIRIILRKKI